MSKINLSSARGFSLFEVIVVAGILAVVAAFSGGLVTNIIAAQKRTQLASEMSGIREVIRTTLKNRTAWDNTLTTAGAGKANSVPVNFVTFAIHDAADNLLFNYNPAVATQGFDPLGRACNTYPSVACPVRFNFQWRRDASTCNATITNCQAEVEIQVTATLAANTPYVGFNPDKLALKIKKAGESYSEVTTSCPTVGDVVTGFDAIGNPTCSPHMAVLAASGGGPSTGAPATGAPATGEPATGAPAPKSPSPKGK